MSHRKSQGAECNAECPGCKCGRLRPIMETVRVGVTSGGVRGQVIHAEVIARLACDDCHASFEAACRGQTIEEVLKDQLEGLQSPSGPPPSSCVACAGGLQRRVDLQASEARWIVPHRFRPFLACPVCLTVAWAGAWSVGDVESKGCCAWLNDGVLP